MANGRLIATTAVDKSAEPVLRLGSESRQSALGAERFGTLLAVAHP